MSPLVGFTKKDLLRDKLVEPAWYLMVIDSVSEWTPSADKQSNNMVLEGTIIKNADTGNTEFQDVPVGGMGSWNFNSKAMGFAKGLVYSVAKQIGLNPEELTEDTRIEFKHLEGKLIECYVEHNTFEGRTRNRINHKYREPRSA